MKTKSKTLRLLLWFFIGLLSLGQLERIEWSSNATYLHDLFIFCWLTIYLTNAIKNKLYQKQSINYFNFNKSYLLETIFFSLVLLTTFFNTIINQDIVAVLYLVRLTFYLIFAVSLRNLVKQKLISTKYLRFQFFSFGLLVLLLGLLQFIFLPDTRFLAILGWDDHYHRLISTIFDPGFTGTILVITYLYLLSLKITNKLTSYLVSLLFFLGIALTFSRASYLSLIFVILTIPVAKIGCYKQKHRIYYSLTSLLVFFIFILIIPKPTGEGVRLSRTSTIDARKNSIHHQLNSLTPTTIIIGNGLFSKKNTQAKANYTIQTHSRIPDNLFINLLLSTGISGTFIAILLGYKYLKRLYKIEKEVTLAILSTIIHSQFNNSLLHPFVLLLLLGGLASIKLTQKNTL